LRRSRWNVDWQGKPKFSEKTCPSATFVHHKIPHDHTRVLFIYYLVSEAIGTAATSGLLCHPRVIVKMIVEKQLEGRLAGETEVLGENLPQRHPDPGLNPGRRGGKPATNRLSYGAA
jgi:hypothetical protein